MTDGANELASMLNRRAALRTLSLTTLGAVYPVSAQTPADAAPSSLPGGLTDRPTRGEQFALAEVLRLASVPSFSLARVQGTRITTQAVGVQRSGESNPVVADTVYAAASLTKAVFAYTFLSFVQDGLVSLDRPVRDYLQLPNPEDPRSRAITARHLLSHTSGWRNWRNAVTTPLTADFEPGSRWSYAGEGYFFLQRVLETLTNRSTSALLQERVFAPLGMQRSSLAPLAELDANRAVGHDGRGAPQTPFGRATMLELRREMSAAGRGLETAKVEDAEAAIRVAEPTLPVLPNFLPLNAAASMLTTASDFARFLQHLVTARRRGGSAASIVAMMMSPQVRCNDRVQWGLGLGLETVGAQQYAWQWGDNPGYKSYFWADPDKEQAMVVFTNGDRGARVYERVIRGLTGDDHPGFLWA